MGRVTPLPLRSHRASPPGLAPRPARIVIAVLGALAAFGPLSTDLYLPSLPATATSLGASPAGIQLTLTASVLGLGIGQLVIGPLSDRHGRRRPLLAGLVLFTGFSIGCALAPSLLWLVAMRLGQALGGSAGLVISRAVVRDLADEDGLVKLLSMLTLVSSLAPVAAPLAGGLLARVTTWRGIFVVLTGVGIVLLVSAARWVGESLPPRRRTSAGMAAAFASYATVLKDRAFMLTVTSFAAAFGALFAYIAASPFALQVIHGFSPQAFSVAFAANAVCLMTGTRVRIGSPRRQMSLALCVLAVAALLVAAAFATGALVPLLAGFAGLCFGWGLLAPSATALALGRHPERAGAAAAVQGAAQFFVAGIVGPLAGVGGSDSLAAPLAVICAAVAVAGGAHLWAARAHPQAQRGQGGP